MAERWVEPNHGPMGLFLQTASPWYARWLCRRLLDGVYVRGLDRVTELAKDRPVILAANHQCWWDGQLILLVFHALRLPGKFLVEQRHVETMGYLTPIGGIGIDRGSMTGALQGVERATSWLSEPGRLLWIFPQGRYRDVAVRPLALERGLRLIVRGSGAVVVPVSIRFGWRDLHLPTCLIVVGEPVDGAERVVERTEAGIEAGLDAASAWFDTKAGEAEVLVPSVVTPFQDRFGARFYLFWSGVVGRVRRAVGL